jgi:hypothetical protein
MLQAALSAPKPFEVILVDENLRRLTRNTPRALLLFYI